MLEVGSGDGYPPRDSRLCGSRHSFAWERGRRQRREGRGGGAWREGVRGGVQSKDARCSVGASGRAGLRDGDEDLGWAIGKQALAGWHWAGRQATVFVPCLGPTL